MEVAKVRAADKIFPARESGLWADKEVEATGIGKEIVFWTPVVEAKGMGKAVLSVVEPAGKGKVKVFWMPVVEA